MPLAFVDQERNETGETNDQERNETGQANEAANPSAPTTGTNINIKLETNHF